ncbi:MAG: hypothetical protein KA371_00255 [Acidobacteria bacterium]|nr:hypothetical protein [Acidobacteriota bacterium]
MPRYWSVDEAWTATDHSPELEREIGRSLSDEVAIDFPSMRGPICRMRAWFGDTVEPEAFAAHVQLSARQAGLGVKVPIDVPLSRACAGCGGRGESWNASCDPCEGTGATIERYPLMLTVPAGVVDGARFAFSVAHPRGHRAYVEVRVSVL